MEAKDLMIGDWVQIVPDAPVMPNEYHRIDWIRTGEIGLDNRKIVTYPYIHPIPLTPEILEKNGFTYSVSESNGLCRTYIYGDKSNHVLAEVTLYDLPINGCSCLIRIETDSQTCGGINKIHNCDLLYVHQLQHALRLCQIEKEINL